jgi:hypothetical protein
MKIIELPGLYKVGNIAYDAHWDVNKHTTQCKLSICNRLFLETFYFDLIILS